MVRIHQGASAKSKSGTGLSRFLASSYFQSAKWTNPKRTRNQAPPGSSHLLVIGHRVIGNQSRSQTTGAAAETGKPTRPPDPKRWSLLGRMAAAWDRHSQGRRFGSSRTNGSDAPCFVDATVPGGRSQGITESDLTARGGGTARLSLEQDRACDVAAGAANTKTDIGDVLQEINKNHELRATATSQALDQLRDSLDQVLGDTSFGDPGCCGCRTFF